jgi:subtilisin family serine protease
MSVPGVRSVRFNDQLTYEDEQANILTSVTRSLVQPAPLVNAEGQPFTGKGITILVNDSGIDASHADLEFGTKVLENAAGHGNGLTEGMAPGTVMTGVINTDVAGSHGTHVAGIAAGDGSASGGQFTGSARGANLIGYGSGAVLFVLDTLGGFDFAMQMLDEHPEYNLRIVTNSFGNTGDVGTCFDPEDPTNIATKALSDRKLIVVFSAGNSGSGPDTITGNFKKAPWVIAVANVEKSSLLAPSSSRGSLARPSYQAEFQGETYTVRDRPTVAAPGTNIVSTRAIAADPFTPLDTQADIEGGVIPLDLIPFYTQKTGTSMAAPHVAGLVAVLLEANPEMTWREVKPLLEKTATNMPGYAPYEVGSGLANVEAALAGALALRSDYGALTHTQRGFFSAIDLGASTVTEVSVDFSPAGPTGEYPFEVGADDSLVLVQWTQPEGNPCTCALVLTDPNGNRYGSSIALPVLGATVAASGPAVAGTWTFTVLGIGSVSGVSVDPAGVTNGVAGPATIDARITV